MKNVRTKFSKNTPFLKMNKEIFQESGNYEKIFKQIFLKS